MPRVRLLRAGRALARAAAVVCVAGPVAAAIQVEVHSELDRRPIDPRIYGVSFGDFVAETPPYPLRRWGGNAVTRYNWQSDTSQRASDYFFQSLPNPVEDVQALPAGSSSDLFVEATLAAGAEILLTVPSIGWTAAAEREKKWSFSQAKYGAQDLDECRFYAPDPPFWCSADSGNGRCESASPPSPYCEDGKIVGNDPNDASLAIDTGFVTDWMVHLAAQQGSAAAGGVRYYALDNEPMLWHETHRDVHPQPTGYDEVWSRSVEVAAAIKATDPAAEIFGPAVWGWCAYFSSAIDNDGVGSCETGPDRAAHGGQAFLPWYLEQVCAYESTHGVRLVDVLDAHFYPQGNVAGLGGASDSEDPTTAARRLRSTRELWDPSYVSESWIGQPVQLIPRLRGWIDAHCPGTELAIGEYRWGSDEGASSALAHAEVLAIFGREGVDAAMRWTAPAPGSRVEEAFRLYLDYDGAGARVLGDSVRATSSDDALVGAYAVLEGATLRLLLFNKSTSPQPVAVQADRVFAQDPQLYGFDADTPLQAQGSVPAAGGTSLALSLPARSATLAVAPLAEPVPSRRPAAALLLAVLLATAGFLGAFAPRASRVLGGGS